MPPSKSSKLLSLLSSWVQYHLSPTCAYPLAAEDMASMMAAMAGKMGPVPPRPFVGKGGKAPIGHSWLGGGGRWWDNSVQGWWRWWWWCFGGQPPSSEKNTLVIHFYEGNLNYPLKKNPLIQCFLAGSKWWWWRRRLLSLLYKVCIVVIVSNLYIFKIPMLILIHQWHLKPIILVAGRWRWC